MIRGLVYINQMQVEGSLMFVVWYNVHWCTEHTWMLRMTPGGQSTGWGSKLLSQSGGWRWLIAGSRLCWNVNLSEHHFTIYWVHPYNSPDMRIESGDFVSHPSKLQMHLFVRFMFFSSFNRHAAWHEPKITQSFQRATPFSLSLSLGHSSSQALDETVSHHHVAIIGPYIERVINSS